MILHDQLDQPADLSVHLVTDGAAANLPDIGPEFAAVAVRLASRVTGWETATLRWADADHLLAAQPTSPREARAFGVTVARAARDLRARTATLPELPAPLAYEAAVGAALATYRFTKYRDAKHPALTALAAPGLDAALLARAQAVAEGVNLARDLVNTPYNDLTAEGLADVARTLAEQHRLDLRVWDRKECERRGLGLFLAVSQGSRLEPQFIRLVYRPESPRRTIALVGKGVMYDTGGYSLKTRQGMLGMKGDMGGAAAVIGAMLAIARLRPDVEVRAYVAATDNAVSDDAMRPGDVFRGKGGKTVEVTNTDAEGRLTLADALAVAQEEAPDLIIDLATLTGAKVTALGNDIAALFATDDTLAEELHAASRRAQEHLWRLPLPERMLKGYKSGIADLKNSDLKPEGAAIKAALFLREFVTLPWAHLDIAGNALRDGEGDSGPAGGTGWGVQTLVELVAPRG